MEETFDEQSNIFQWVKYVCVVVPLLFYPNDLLQLVVELNTSFPPLFIVHILEVDNVSQEVIFLIYIDSEDLLMNLE